MSSIVNYIDKLIRSNTGVSSKSFALVAITLMGCVLLLVIGFILVWEEVRDGQIRTDLGGLAELVGSITALLASAGVTKVVGERNERNNNEKKDKQ
jgi:hypothetical protein